VVEQLFFAGFSGGSYDISSALAKFLSKFFSGVASGFFFGFWAQSIKSKRLKIMAGSWG
jgi:hypothetical protein